MGARQAVLITVVAVNVEAVDTVHSLKLLEAVKGYLGRACHELDELGLLLLVKGTHRTPEPLNLWRCRRVVVILSVAFPVVHVNVGQARNEQLEFLLVEDGN